MRLEVKRKGPQRRPVANKTNFTLGKAVTETCQRVQNGLFVSFFAVSLAAFFIVNKFFEVGTQNIKIAFNKGKGFKSNFKKLFLCSE